MRRLVSDTYFVNLGETEVSGIRIGPVVIQWSCLEGLSKKFFGLVNITSTVRSFLFPLFPCQID